MKLLFYINHIGIGGAERVMVNLCNRFAENGDRVFLVTSEPDPSDCYVVSPKVSRVILCESRIDNFLIRNFVLCVRLKKFIDQIQPQVAISFLGEPNLRLLFLNLNKVRKLVSIRNDPFREYPSIFKQSLFKYFLKNADGVICQTPDVIKWLPVKFRSKCNIIMNQVEDVFYSTNRKSKIYYVALGRLAEQKNFKLLINSFTEFLSIHPTAELRIYGNGELKAELLNLIKKNRVDKQIKIFSSVSNVQEVLANAKCFVLSSNYEGLPNALLEAFAVGLPVIATDCPCGGPRMIINEDNGILIPMQNQSALVKALCKIEEDPFFADKIAFKAKLSSKSNQSSEIFKKWESYIYEVK
ncbi:MAG: glycosyltransferase [Bacteroidales bacterium]